MIRNSQYSQLPIVLGIVILVQVNLMYHVRLSKSYQTYTCEEFCTDHLLLE